MSDDTAYVLAGDCTTRFADGTDDRRTRGSVVVLVKPDDTVLVHDAEGYRPTAWLTRADEARITSDEEGFLVSATKGDQRLEVLSHRRFGIVRYPVTPAGDPVGECPDCGGELVRAGRTVRCLGCALAYTIPRDAEIRGEPCSCGLPTMRVERGAAFDLCIDRTHESLDEAVRARFDREWECPECGGDLLVLRRRGLLAGCENYPECDTGFAVPEGVVAGECGCGLPTFETGGGVRCLDATCERGSG